MTTPPEYTPTPEQVTVMILQIRQACPWYLELQTVAWLARYHMAELHRETETLRSQLATKSDLLEFANNGFLCMSKQADELRSQLDALKAQVEAAKLTLEKLQDGEHAGTPINKGCAAMVMIDYALAQLSPK